MTKYFELKGGLGNQLFQYFAGQNIARESGERMVFILPNSRQHNQHVDSSILDLDLPRIVNTEFIDPQAGLMQFDRGRQWLSRKSEKSRLLFNRCSNTYVSGTIGFDPDLQNFIGSSFFKGYFQSYRYVDAFREVLEFTLTPVRPGLKYIEYLSEIREKRPTVMHIRRGDYKYLKKTIGLLSTDYYKNSLDVVNEQSPDTPIWVFSDDLEGAQQIIQNLGVKFDKIVSPDLRLSAAETLILMSEGSNKIIANSTFSWWAAYLGSSGGEVIAPSPWYRTNSINAELIPSNWNLIDSFWEN